MDSSTDLIKVIKRYQQCIQQINPVQNDSKRILHYIHKLAKLPIRIEELEETGIGKTINGLSKASGKVGDEASKLVTRWKAVANKQFEEEKALEQRSGGGNCDQSTSYSCNNSSPVHTARNAAEPSKLEYNLNCKNVVENVDEKEKYESMSPSKVHLITIKREECHNKKRKHHSEDGERKAKKEKHSKPEPHSRELLDEPPELDIQLEPCARLENVDVAKHDKKKKSRENEKKSHKKSHEKRHHKSSKHKEEKSHRESKHHREDENRSQHHSDDKNIDSHKHKRLKKSKSRNKEENRAKKNRKTSEESVEAEGNCRNAASRDVNSHTNNEAPGDIFGAALLGIPVTSSPKKKITAQSSNHQDARVTSSPKSNHTAVDFLSNNVKLEPLSKDLGISDIPDYAAEAYRTPSKFNNIKPETSPKVYCPPPKPSTPKLSEEDMFSSMALMKNRRTKVYHGTKVNNSKIPTLFDLCVRVLQDNFDALEYTGGIPFEVIRPILERVSAEQLYTFENYNPYLIGETDELWEQHAKKHFKKAERQEYETWRDLYLRCVEEREEKLHSVTDHISQSMAKSAPVRKTKLAYVDAFVKPPRNVARQQAKHGTGGNAGSKKPTKESHSTPSPVMSVKERLAKEACSASAIQIPTKAVKKKAAPLMQKTLQLFKGLKR